MSVLAVGLSHRSAPVHLLEQVSAGANELTKLLHGLLSSDHVAEALVLSTCNRVEVYAEVEKFHGGVQEITELLARATGVPLEELTGHLYVHYEDRAVQHLFTVACGLDSMVVGEQQILGQLRSAYRTAREHDGVGRVLGPLAQQALRVGKRAHAETGIDRAGQSLVSVGLELADRALDGITGRSAVLVGAGSMSALAGASLRRLGVGEVTVVNRTAANAARLADHLDGRHLPWSHLGDALVGADVVICSTGATGVVVDASHVVQAMAARPDRPMFVLDLALPRDVDPAVREVAGVTLADLESMRGVLEGAEASQEVEAARRLVTDEVGAFLAWQRSVRVAPTVTALRAKAQEVVDAELLRLDSRLPGLDERVRDELGATVRRVVDKLLHAPTVRVKQLAEAPGGDSYAEALSELFALDPSATEVVTRAAVVVEEAVEADEGDDLDDAAEVEQP
jgi:glutamyl-tRNA reductase